MSVRWCGPRAFLVERADLDAVLSLHAALRESPPPGLVEAVPAARTLLLSFRDAPSATRGADHVAALRPSAADAATGREFTIDVVYDGEDLADVAELTGLSVEGVIEAHTRAPWTAAFGGFAPGFFYLTGGDPRLAVPRRPSPRTAVPAGAVGLAGEFSAVYPRRSPGGWQLIGRTAEAMFDPGREPAALLSPGDRVTFRPVREAVTAKGEEASGGDSAPTSSAPALEVVDPGLGLLVEDAGRPGRGDIGVTASGAADPAAAAQANRLVGNDPGAAVLENLLGGLTLRASGTLVVALTGAASGARIGGDRPRAAPPRAPFALRDGETLSVDAAEHGLRVYVAVRGGLDVPTVLGSRSRDTLSGLGPEPLQAGSRVPVGAAPRSAVGAPEPPTPLPRPEETVLRVLPGPRDDWFASLAPLLGQAWVTSDDSDRVGVRLSPADEGGGPLARVHEDELPSEGVVAGALQVPPNGLPVLFLADHPVTGGYPVAACVHPDDLPLAAQLPPGSRLRFRKDPT